METKPLTQEEVDAAINVLLAAGSFSKRYEGKDNYGHPKVEYLKKMVLMTDPELEEECKTKIWLSAYANNNARSDYHWQCDCCYDECERREKGHIYTKAYNYNVSNNS